MTIPTQSRRTERPGRPVANPDRDAREMLLTAATELFAERGVAATSFARIATRARLTPAMVHYYFEDREQLMDAVVEERMCPFIAYVWDPVQAGGDPAELIRGIVVRLLTGIERAPWVPSTWMREILNEGGLLRGRVLPRIPVEKVRMVGQAIHQGQLRQTANPELDPLLTVFSMFGLVMLHMATVKVWAEVFQRQPLEREVLARHITGLLLDGLRGPRRPPERLLKKSDVPVPRGLKPAREIKINRLSGTAEAVPFQNSSQTSAIRQATKKRVRTK